MWIICINNYDIDRTRGTGRSLLFYLFIILFAVVSIIGYSQLQTKPKNELLLNVIHRNVSCRIRSPLPQ